MLSALRGRAGASEGLDTIVAFYAKAL